MEDAQKGLGPSLENPGAEGPHLAQVGSSSQGTSPSLPPTGWGP